VAYSSPNVYSLVFELAVADPAATPAAGVAASGAQAQQQESQPLSKSSIPNGLPEADAELVSIYASWPFMGRFQLLVDTAVRATASADRDGDEDNEQKIDDNAAASESSLSSLPLPSSCLTLSWPIDIAIMSGAQDLHLVLSFPQQAYMGKLLTLTLTVLHMRGANKRRKKPPAATHHSGTDSAPTSATSGAAVGGSVAPPLSLLYSVQCAPHLWLLCGKQSAAFCLAEGEQRSFPIQLLPVASGYLPIPLVDILQQQQTSSVQPQQQPPPHSSGAPVGSGSRGVLQQAADKLSDLARSGQLAASASSSSTSALRVSTARTEENIGAPHAIPAACASASAAPSLEYSSIPPARILRHFATNQQIHVFPPTSFATQVMPMQ
jgi:hypothetical protein